MITTPLARVQYQGGSATLVTEEGGTGDVQGATGSGKSFADVLINTVYHRATFLFQGLTDFGSYIDMSATGAPYSYSDLGYVTQQINAGNYFGFYPLSGQTGVSLHTHPELPSPLPAGADATTYGSPIHVASQETTTLTVTTFTVTQQGSTTAMPATLLLGTVDPNMAGNNNVAFLVANQAFLPNTTYTVNFAGTITGTATGSTAGIPISKTWSFTTGTTSN